MDAVFSQFTLLSDQALQDKNFDPFVIEDVMKLFEIEAYDSWAAMEMEHQREVLDAETRLREAELYLDSEMDSAMAEFLRFEQEMEGQAKAELKTLVETAEKARKMGNLMEKAATVVSRKYIEVATNSATASMKAAWKAVSSNKVHPS